MKSSRLHIIFYHLIKLSCKDAHPGIFHLPKCVLSNPITVPLCPQSPAVETGTQIEVDADDHSII